MRGAAGPNSGTKTSLIVKATTALRIGPHRPTGSISLGYGIVHDAYGLAGVRGGSQRVGNFVQLTAWPVADSSTLRRSSRSTRRATIYNLFDRFDARLSAKTSLQLNLFAARSELQTPNTFDQQDAGQDQRQSSTVSTLAPSLTHTLGPACRRRVQMGGSGANVVQLRLSANPFE